MGPFFSFKGFDNNIYYLLTPEGYYYNFSGCGNTLNCNHPIVHQMILDCLRYWVTYRSLEPVSRRAAAWAIPSSPLI